ncbi:DEKNAAC101566 [Brettanomyces naardenensis]|uniref:DEKNAAC101566 n=1 Tax=Brettanomyces naardenensis TaxID=13370 RepID=A0A448YIR5_BRENA|nr:DEKNAAC101566 [Brettanomyces naardenensis]
MGRKNRTKSKSHRTRTDSRRRALDAYELATAEGDKGRDDSEEEIDSNQRIDSKYGDTVIDARSFLKGMNEEGLEIESFKDEEIDSDEAFGSEEESDDEDLNREKFEGDLDDDEELEYDGINSDQLLPLSAIWDRDEGAEEDKETGKGKDIVLDDSDGDDLDSSDGDEDNGDSSSDEDASDESEVDVADTFDVTDNEEHTLTNVLTKLKKELPKEPKKKVVLVNDNAEENEFSLPTQGKGLSFADMMVGDEQEPLLLGDEGASSSSAFDVPLPQSIEKRQERKAAYEIQKDEVDKWKDLVRSNRQAEVLKFGPDKVTHAPTSSFTPTEKPINELESKIDEVLKASNMESKKTEDMFEKIESAKISKEDLIKRTNELRLMRELMYRGQKDSKRLKKIKSKAYRRIKRKERIKNEKLVNEAEGRESDEDAEEASYERIKERMTLKHKNTSDWAKKMIKSGMSKDSKNRDEMEEMLRRSESLRKKQMGRKDEEDSDEYDERDVSDIEKEEEIEVEKSKLGKGVLAMDFMVAAAERERKSNLEEIERMRNLEEGEEVEDNGINLKMNGGRRVYTPSAAIASRKMKQEEEKMKEEESEDKVTGLSKKLRKKNKVINDDVNPWFEDATSVHKSSKVHVIDEKSSKLEKSAAKIEKKKNKRSRGKRSRDDDDDDLEIVSENTLNIVDVKKQRLEGEEEYEGEGDKEEDIRVFKQKDLIREAFAGDEVIEEEFEAEKREVEGMEDDKEEVDEGMPGWGSWGGFDEGDKKKRKGKGRRKAEKKIVRGVVSKDQRMDKGKKNVIINERVNKKNAKYLADKVPYPFKTWEQYERSLRTPIGQDWNSRHSFQKMTMPRVLAKFGDVIDPMKKDAYKQS